MIKIVDILNIYGLILKGVGLFIGLWVGFAAISGIVLLVLYYFAYLPFGVSFAANTGGHLFIVNTVFIVAMVLFYLVISRKKGYGLDNIQFFRKKYKEVKAGMAGINAINIGYSSNSLLTKYKKNFGMQCHLPIKGAYRQD